MATNFGVKSAIFVRHTVIPKRNIGISQRPWRVNSSDDSSTSDINLVSFCPVTPGFTRLGFTTLAREWRWHIGAALIDTRF